MAFIDERFPELISYDAVERIRHSTDLVQVESGIRASFQNWAFPLREFDMSHAARIKSYMDTVVAFDRAVSQGRQNTFRVKPWADFEVTAAQGVFTDLGAGLFQMWKRYTFGSTTKDFKVTLPVNGTITVTGAGSYSISYTTGIVTALGSPTQVPTAWAGEFDVIGRMGQDISEYVIRNKSSGAFVIGTDEITVLEERPS